MKAREIASPDGRVIDIETGMDALDVLEENMHLISDRINALWDKVVGVEGGDPDT